VSLKPLSPNCTWRSWRFSWWGTGTWNDRRHGSTRTPYFVYEEGEWKHAFGEKEIEIFMQWGTLSTAGS
jgi:hypothetical protein